MKNKEKEKTNAAVEYAKQFDLGPEYNIAFDSFIEGANWSDEHPKEGMISIEKVKEFLGSVDLNFYREWEDKFNTDELIIDLEKYLEK